MANAEVSVPVGDVVVVPSEGNEGENPEDTKTQVILQLQPVQQGWVIHVTLHILEYWQACECTGVGSGYVCSVANLMYVIQGMSIFSMLFKGYFWKGYTLILFCKP